MATKKFGLFIASSSKKNIDQGSRDCMELKEIISTLMLSEFYFSLPLWERKQVVLRLWAIYGSGGPAICNFSGFIITPCPSPGGWANNQGPARSLPGQKV
jgi:hypothetical protein